MSTTLMCSRCRWHAARLWPFTARRAAYRHRCLADLTAEVRPSSSGPHPVPRPIPMPSPTQERSMYRNRTRPENKRRPSGHAGDRPASPIRDRHDDERHGRREQRVVAAYHAETTRRSRARTVELVLAGYNVGRVPYGYRPQRTALPIARDRAEGTVLAVEPIEAATVAMVFSWRTRDHLGLAEIARRLNTARYPRPFHPVTQEEMAWTGGRIARILANPVYTGRSVWGRARHGRRLPVDLWVLSARREYLAIVSDEQFVAAQGAHPQRLALATRLSTGKTAACSSVPHGRAGNTSAIGEPDVRR